MKRKASFIVSLGGIVSALCIIIMFLTGIMPIFVYTLPALAGALMVIIVVEISIKWAFVTYATVSLLSLLITPNKEAVVLFIMFLGYYPIIKSLLERKKSRAYEWILKVLGFNISIIIAYQIIIRAFGMTDALDQFGNFGRYGALFLLVLGNIVFVIYDIALTKVISAYINSFRPKILRKFK